MDDTLKVTLRQADTFAMAVSHTGGFMTVIFLVTLVIVQRLQKTIYFTSLIASIYQYQPDTLSGFSHHNNPPVPDHIEKEG